MMELLPLFPTWFGIVFSFFTGLAFGSFANVVIYRLPLKKSVINPPSFCPVCLKRLAAIDLIPVLSWVFLLGKCRSCKCKISVRYPATELVCGLLFASMMHFTPTLSAIPLSILAFVLLIVSGIDWDTQEIPDGLLIIAAIIGVIWVVLGHFFPVLFPYSPAWQNALLGVLAGAAPLFIIDKITLLVLKKDGFGYGDMKLMAVVGVFLGWQLTLGAFFFAVLGSFPFALYFIIKRRQQTSDCEENGYMAFGPFLCAGVLGAFWFGEWFFNLLFVF